MSSLNKVQLIGRLGQDPKISYTTNGTAVANVSLATDESYKGQDGQKVTRTEWHKVVLWGKPAEFAGKYLAKGRLVYIEGKNQTRKWQDQNGNDRYTTEVKAHVVQALEKKDDSQYQKDAPVQQEEREGAKTGSPMDEMDDAPF